MKRLIFRFYWAIAIVAFGLAVYFTTEVEVKERLPLLGSATAVILGFCYFVQQQRLAETLLFKELFTEFNSRYDAMNERLAGVLPSATPTPDQRNLIVDYFNLCAEEYLFYREGFILPEAWQAWCRGMLQYLNNEPFQSIWREETESQAYYGLSADFIRQGAA